MEEQEFTVYFTATFVTKVRCKPSELSDELADIDIPESETCKYNPQTFEVESVQDNNGKQVDWQEDDE